MRLRAVILGKRTHDLGVLGNESGVDNVVLQEFADKGIEKTSRRVGRGALQLMLVKQSLELDVDLGIIQGRKLAVHLLLESLHHGNTRPRGLEVNLNLRCAGLGAVLDLVIASDLLDHVGDHLLSHVHEVLVVGVSLVELTGGELRVVSEINTLIAELTANLIHTVQTTNDQHLQVQLGSDTEVQVHVQVVVMGDEGLGNGTTGDHVHHRCLNLKEVTLIKVTANTVDDLGTDGKGVANVLVDDKIQITLAVTSLHVGQTTEVGIALGKGKHVQAGGEEGNFGGEDGKLTLARLAGMSLHADDVTALDGAVDLVEGLLSSGVGLEVGHDLYLGSITTDVVEEELALSTDGVDTSSDGYSLIGQSLSISRLGTVHIVVVRETVIDLEFVRVGVASLLLQSSNGRLTVGLVGGGVENLLLNDLGLLGLVGGLGSLYLSAHDT